MGSMNTNNWLSFHDLPSTQQSHQFSLGLVNEAMDNINIPFQHHQEWNLINSEGNNDIPKMADFLGMSTGSHHTDMVAYNEPISSVSNDNNDSDNAYLFQTNDNNNNNAGLAQVVHQSSVISNSSSAYDYHESSNNNHNPSSNNLQALTLSMGTTSGKAGSTCTELASADNSSNAIVEATPRRTLDTFGQRTSIYRGVTRHRWTGRYEAHLWDNSCRREGQSRKGRQVYLGGYDKEEKAARAYDMAALKYWGTSTTTNFPISNYEKELEEMKHMTRQEFVASIRRKSSGFSRGASMYRGVTRHHQHGRWQARIGRVAGNKDLYLGTFSTEEEAAEAYDIAAIKFRGLNAVTNFDMNRYDVKSILESNSLPIGGGAAKRLKEAQALESSRTFHYGNSSSTAATTATSSISNNAHRLLQPYHSFDHHHSLLTFQNHDIVHDPNAYIHTQLQLQQQQQHNSSPYDNNYMNHNGYNNAGLVQGLMSHHMSDNSASNSISAGYNNSVTHTGIMGNDDHHHHNQDLALVKVDYDVPSGTGYGGWPGSASSSNPGFFSMWNNE